jgi:hypothetical protein
MLMSRVDEQRVPDGPNHLLSSMKRVETRHPILRPPAIVFRVWMLQERNYTQDSRKRTGTGTRRNTKSPRLRSR